MKEIGSIDKSWLTSSKRCTIMTGREKLFFPANALLPSMIMFCFPIRLIGLCGCTLGHAVLLLGPPSIRTQQWGVSVQVQQEERRCDDPLQQNSTFLSVLLPAEPLLCCLTCITHVGHMVEDSELNVSVWSSGELQSGALVHINNGNCTFDIELCRKKNEMTFEAPPWKGVWTVQCQSLGELHKATGSVRFHLYNKSQSFGCPYSQDSSKYPCYR